MKSGSRTDYGFYNYQSPNSNTSNFGNNGPLVLSNTSGGNNVTGGDYMSSNGGFNDTKELRQNDKKSSRRQRGESRKKSSKKQKYKDMLKDKDLLIKELNQSLMI